MSVRKPRVTCRTERNETGLARVCQSPRGYDICIDGKPVVRVACVRRSTDGWYFYGMGHNTYSDKHWTTKEEARDAAIAFVKAEISQTEHERA